MGMVVDLVELDGILRDEIVTPFEGRNLNQDVAEFASGTLPTCESLAALVYRRVAARLPAGVTLPGCGWRRTPRCTPTAPGSA